jgi:putative FmdB family regulatory protein
MPIYEYRCSKCGKTFEKIQKFVDPPVEVHEECGGPVERLISTSALQFKGSGFYITDYKGASKSAESKSEGSGHSGHSEHGGGESKSDSKSEGKSEGKSESKSEGKSESKSVEGRVPV